MKRHTARDIKPKSASLEAIQAMNQRLQDIRDRTRREMQERNKGKTVMQVSGSAFRLGLRGDDDAPATPASPRKQRSKARTERTK